MKGGREGGSKEEGRRKKKSKVALPESVLKEYTLAHFWKKEGEVGKREMGPYMDPWIVLRVQALPGSAYIFQAGNAR